MDRNHADLVSCCSSPHRPERDSGGAQGDECSNATRSTVRNNRSASAILPCVSRFTPLQWAPGQRRNHFALIFPLTEEMGFDSRFRVATSAPCTWLSSLTEPDDAGCPPTTRTSSSRRRYRHPCPTSSPSPSTSPRSPSWSLKLASADCAVRSSFFAFLDSFFSYDSVSSRRL